MRSIVFSLILLLLGTMFSTVIVHAESFTWPSAGYLGYKYLTQSNHSWDIEGKYHTGLDIWSNTNGGWNNGVVNSSNAIYSAYPGKVEQIYGTPGILIKHNDNLYTKYWHVRDIQVAVNQYVDTNTILAYQTYDGTVHVHVTIASAPGSKDADNVIDPSSYFGLQLNANKPNLEAWLYEVKRLNGCGGAIVTLSNYNNTGSGLCSATSQITILPNSYLSGNQTYFIQ